jgi:transcriptional regulator with XRE-family HTH domain
MVLKEVITLRESMTLNFGNVLKRLRKEKRLSQEEIAFRANIDRTYISMLERNTKQPTITTIFGLARALEMKTSKLVEEVEKEVDYDFEDNK